MFLLLFILLFLGSDGFLLDNHQNAGNESSIKGSYLTVSAFLEERDLLKQETERVRGDVSQFRHDVNQKLSILTSQLQEKFGQLEKRDTCCIKLNETTKALSELEKNYSSLEQQFNDLQNNYKELKQNHNMLVNNMQRNNIIIGNKISDLMQLGSIKPLQEVLYLNQTVTSLQTQTSVLALKEQSRAQDFMALYNMTTRLQQELNTSTQQVALTAYYTRGGVTNHSEVLGVKFNQVTLNVGIKNIDSFKSSGKFICEIPGLYLISTSIMAATTDTDFYVFRNNEMIAQGAMGYEAWFTSSAVVILHLSVNDSIWVRYEAGRQIYGGRTCYLSIIKVK